MKNEVARLQEVLGNTPEGSAWALKALHPADPVVEVAGLPDDTSTNVVMLNYQAAYTIRAPSETIDPTWGFVMQVQSNPVNFGYWIKTDENGGPSGTFSPLLNPQLVGTTIMDKAIAWSDKVKRWRMAYMSITLDFDGPALSNQGSIAGTMAPHSPFTFYYGAQYDTVGSQIAFHPIRAPSGPSSSDFPNFSRIISNPNAYSGEARDGIYMPLKLTRTHQQWKSEADIEHWVNYTQVAEKIVLAIPTAASLTSYPHPGLTSFYSNPITKMADVRYIPPFGNDLVGHIAAKNLSVASGFNVIVRAGFECQVGSGSELTPFMRLSPPSDRLALESYFQISRTMKDGYPASYNSLGKLWNIIRGAAIALSPAIAAIPHPAAKGIGAGIGLIASALPAHKERRKKAETMPQAAKQELTREVEAKVRSDQRQRPKRPARVRRPKQQKQKA
jgi:hypothetical protein